MSCFTFTSTPHLSSFTLHFPVKRVLTNKFHEGRFWSLASLFLAVFNRHHTTSSLLGFLQLMRNTWRQTGRGRAEEDGRDIGINIISAGSEELPGLNFPTLNNNNILYFIHNCNNFLKRNKTIFDITIIIFISSSCFVADN